jgi:hypothetical protein
VRKKNKKKEKKVQRPIVFQGIKEKVFLEESTTFNSDLKFPQQLNRKKKSQNSTKKMTSGTNMSKTIDLIQ